MKKLIVILFSLISISLNATKYYCATAGGGGDNAHPGTLAEPWLTWQYAFDNTPGSDTCYFRGGVYNTTTGVSAGYIGGTYSHPTCFFNYPGERPILDNYGYPSASGEHSGINLISSSYVYLKGLEIRNVRQRQASQYGNGFEFYQCHGYIRVEQCVAHHVSSQGFSVDACDTVNFTNCDAYHCADTLTTYDPGGGGTGFNINSYPVSYSDPTQAKYSYSYFKGCRAWNCSDNGMAGVGGGTVIWDSCWAINNGFEWSYDVLNSGNYGTNGNGWKYDGFVMPNGKRPGIVRILKNCIAAYNEYQGFCENSNAMPQTEIQVYNNFAYHNGFTHKDNIQPTVKYGFVTLYNSDTVGYYNHWYRNNLSYNNGNGDLFVGSNRYENNYWDTEASVTDVDFVSLDTTGMMGIGTRQANGNLPYTNFGHLAPGSNLIDAGTTNTGLPYAGAAPDVGWVESGTLPLVTSIDIMAAGGATTITIEDGTLQLYTKVLPVNASDTSKTWSITNGTGEATITQTGLVTAVTDGNITANATANDGSGIHDHYVITLSNQTPAPGVGLPAITTSGITSWTTTSAYFGSNVITDDGGGTISDKGLAWGTSVNPTIAGNHAHCGTGTATFGYDITGLIAATVYHVRAFVVNEEGMTYGNDVSFGVGNDKIILNGTKIILDPTGKIIIIE